jgi:hypothetical protein
MRSNRLNADEGGVPPNKVVHRTFEHVAVFRAASLHVRRGKRWSLIEHQGTWSVGGT